MRRGGVLSQLPVSLPVTSSWNDRARCNVAVTRRRQSAQPNVVTTHYGWIDADKENVELDQDKDRGQQHFAAGTRLPAPQPVSE